uniref:N-domain of Clp chaperone n=1 Tax=Eustigmatophyceae sp. Bat 8/9-7w TaxID=2506144 RepID=A0A3R5QMU5_9STRA|nr:N-domain of Clp chaperone [Eustigmatophyceae sp. Bat 8/9-7w]QAA11481.1 N-domain of Clp chaperone [Eustigmatophyceae sp. Bat 8/9-7w]
MQNSNKNNSRNLQSRFYKILRRKVFFSNELKKALLVAYYEAKKNQTCVDLNLLLYGLLSQSESLACRLFLTALSKYQKNTSLNSKLIKNKIQKINKKNLKDKGLKNLSIEVLNENKKTPWLMPEVKQTIITSIDLALQSKKKIVVVTTKNVFFDLLSNELIRDSIRKLID